VGYLAKRASLVLTVVAVGIAAFPAEAPAPDNSKHCALVTKGGKVYRVKARAVRCKFANRWVKRYFRSRRVAPGYRFTETSGGKAPWYCTKGARKAYWPERL
jgi:hypothetical protein